MLIFGMHSSGPAGYKTLSRKEAIERYGNEFVNERFWVHLSTGGSNVDAIPKQFRRPQGSEQDVTNRLPIPTAASEYAARLSEQIRWILDSGSGNDLVDAASAHTFEQAVHKTSPITLSTAGGPHHLTQC